MDPAVEEMEEVEAGIFVMARRVGVGDFRCEA
jgi:hypothetical protein